MPLGRRASRVTVRSSTRRTRTASRSDDRERLKNLNSAAVKLVELKISTRIGQYGPEQGHGTTDYGTISRPTVPSVQALIRGEKLSSMSFLRLKQALPGATATFSASGARGPGADKILSQSRPAVGACEVIR